MSKKLSYLFNYLGETISNEEIEVLREHAVLTEKVGTDGKQYTIYNDGLRIAVVDEIGRVYDIKESAEFLKNVLDIEE